MAELNAMDLALATMSDDDLDQYLQAHPALYCQDKHLGKLKERKEVKGNARSNRRCVEIGN